MCAGAFYAFLNDSLWVIHLLYSCSLQALSKKLLSEESFQSEKNVEYVMKGGHWHLDREIVYAIWTLVRLCGSDDGSTAGALVSDFISRVLTSDFLFILLFLFIIIIIAVYFLIACSPSSSKAFFIKIF